MKWDELLDVKIVDDYNQFIVKDIPEPKVVKVVDLSEDSINEIAEAVVRKIKEQEQRQIRHGHWKGKPIAGYSTVRCSECGDVFMENSGKWNYCPNCGAKMDEVEDND